MFRAGEKFEKKTNYVGKMCQLVLTIDILLDHDKINKRQIIDMLHKGLHRFVIEDSRFHNFQLTLTLSSNSPLRVSTLKKDIEQIFSENGKEKWLDAHTELRLKSLLCRN